MRDAIRRYVDAAQSLTEVPRDRAERIARRLASSGLIERTQIRSVTSDLVDRSRENRRRITKTVATELQRQISRLGLATKSDFEALNRRVRALESATRRAAGEAKTAATRRRPPPAKKRTTPARRKPASRRR